MTIHRSFPPFIPKDLLKRILLSGALLLLAALIGPNAVLAAFDSTTLRNPGEPLEIVRITPSGEDVPPGRQIVFEFNQPVVPLGRMERGPREIPAAIEPQLECRWRWLNPYTLSCRLDEKDALKPATRYRITVSPGAGIMTANKITLAEALTHEFITERPRVESTWLKQWISPGSPVMAVRFNQPVGEASLAEHIFFQGGGGRRTRAKVSEDPDYNASGNGDKKGIAWLVSPEHELTPDEAVDLSVEPGVLSTLGSEPGIEDRVLNAFHTFPEFRFLGVGCETNSGDQILISPGKPLEAQPRCSSTREISLKFSSPATAEEVRNGIRITPDPASERKDYDPWEDVYSYSRLSESHEKDKAYEVPLPWYAMKPYTEYRLEVASGATKDEFDRPLSSPIDMSFATDHYLPKFTLIKQMPVLEKELDSEVPLTVTNLDRVEINYEVLTAKGRTEQLTKELQAPKGQDRLFTIPLGLRELIPASSGIAQGYVSSQPEVRPEAWFFGQITPFHVHAKIGHHNTLVWITDLKSGKPVAGAQVEVRKEGFGGFGTRPEVLSKGMTGEDGLAELSGTSTLDPELKLIYAHNLDNLDDPRLFVYCKKGDDIAAVPLRYDFQVASEGANREYISEWLRPLHGHIHAWGATAQGIYKVGDTVQFKIYVRDQDNRRFVPAPKSGYALKVMDPMDKVAFEKKDIHLSEFGAFDGEFEISKNAAVGWYRFVLSSTFTNDSREPMRVLVSDFTPSPFKVSVDLNGNLFSVGDTVRVTTQAKLHAGGPYANANTRISASVESRPLEPRDSQARGFIFDVRDTSEEEDSFSSYEREHDSRESHTIFQTEGTLNDNGVLENEFIAAESPVLYGKLTVESAVRDDRGKSVANRTSAAYVGRDRYVGVFQEEWVLKENKPSKVRVLVVDQEGKPASGTAVQIRVERRETRASRVKGAGNAYPAKYVHEWVDESQSDELISMLEPLDYEFTPKRSGTYRISARIKDTLGRDHQTRIQRWVSGRSVVLWESIAGNLLDVYPEKEEYGVGEVARFLVQNPFPGAMALITVERFGVLKAWVKSLETSTEIVEVPVEADYLPGFYLSVVVMSPRVEKPVLAEDGSDSEDMGKPAYRMGYAQIAVKDPYKEIAVHIKPEKDVYKPSDTVTVDFKAELRNISRGEPSPPVELAVAVLDEAVFDLLRQGRSAFDPYQGFYSLDPLDLSNYNLLMQLVGRQKLEKKGANQGGGGGPDLGLRSVFKFVSYWNPSIRLDMEGRAKIQFNLPDNLTGWRVLAMAVTPEDRMGLGETLFRVNQPTEIRPVLPNQVMEGDSFEAGFSVMNRTEGVRTIKVAIEAEGPIATEAGEGGERTEQQIVVEPYKRTTIRLPVRAQGPGEIIFTARAGDDLDRDAMRQTLVVQRRQSFEVAAAFGTTTEGEVSEALEFPENIRTDAGNVSVTASPSVTGNLEGAFEYLRGYPFACWEQMLTRAVTAAVYQKLKAYVPKSFSWEESAEIPDKILSLAAEHQTPDGGMAFYVPKNEYADPYLSAYTALAFNWLREYGYSVPQQVEAKLDEYLQSLLRRDTAPDFYSSGMASTVRAVALAALAERGKITRSDIDRFFSHVPEMSLFGRALFLEALIRVDGTLEMQQQVLEGILAHSDQSSGTLIFSESLDIRYQRLLTSSLRDNSAILSSFLAFELANPSQAILGDIPFRLMRTLIQSRKGRNHWYTTQANIFAVKALSDFSRIYETKEPDMLFRAFMDTELLGEVRFNDFADPPASFERAIDANDPGRKATVKLERSGEGRIYYSASLRYAPAELKMDPANAGIELYREYSVEREGKWVLLQNPMEIKTGDLVRVDLFLSLPAERHFVVVEDRVPGGLEPVSRDLATASLVDAAKAEPTHPEGSFWYRHDDWMDFGYSRWSFYHKELRHDVVRFYSEVLGSGRYHLSYVAQAIAPGEFFALPSHAEEMYNPDVFGKSAPASLKVKVAE